MAVDLQRLGPRGIVLVKAMVWAIASIPFARIVHGVFTNALGPNPVEFMQRQTGWYALVLLCVTLTVTPARKLLKMPWLVRLRRLLGLFAFFYAVLHITTWLWFDHGLVVAEWVKDVVKRPFITVGFAAFVIMASLAATSPRAIVKRMGAPRWQALHRAIYVLAPLAVLHFWWDRAGKHDLARPTLFAVIVAVLLGYRLVARFAKTTPASAARAYRAS